MGLTLQTVLSQIHDGRNIQILEKCISTYRYAKYLQVLGIDVLDVIPPSFSYLPRGP